ncbi:major capsid protein [Nocardiopsis tropica]|uniref:Phage major capsid protein n=1 Tax=Nocardiopsis tropica TaxID=109330 RepID=A0ABU7KQY7_9ACTN|nr:phage major capsid protein [Nocardiopsis umidischolae]MEE2051692.1 phage major capsid protein [Nocardiopsis umidischolae]
MPVTLAQAQINSRDDIDHAVIDNLRRYSWLMSHMVFDNTATPGAGGDSLVYGYTRLTQARGAGFRAFNTEYPASTATREQHTVNLKPFGGSFTLDRNLRNLGPQAQNEMAFQTQQLIVGSTIAFQSEIIHGDTAVNTLGFDGLDKSLAGESTEYLPIDNDVSTGYLDWRITAVNTQALAMVQLERLDDWLSRIVPSTVGGGDQGEQGALPPGVKAILGNTASINRIKGLARWAGMYTETKDDLGRMVSMYGSWVLQDIGDTFDGSGPIIPIETRDADGAGAGGSITGLTDLYAVSFGLDSFHGASMASTPLVEFFPPDWGTPGAVKTGELEIGPAAVVLRNTKSCGVLRNVRVSGS